MFTSTRRRSASAARSSYPHALEKFIPAIAEDLAVFRVDVEKPAVLDDRHSDQGMLDEALKLRVGSPPVDRRLRSVHFGNLAPFARRWNALMSGPRLVSAACGGTYFTTAVHPGQAAAIHQTHY